MNNQELFKTLNTIAKSLIKEYMYPYEILPQINKFILDIGPKLGPEFHEVEKNIWVHESAFIEKTAHILPPCIIDANAKIYHNAFLKGNVIVGKNSVVGNSEIKNSILFDEVIIPHFNYIGDSIIGYHSHFGAGSITSNLRSDYAKVVIKTNPPTPTNLEKVGAFLGDYVEIGCNAVLTPGTIIGSNSTIYPLTLVRGIIKENSILKNNNQLINKNLSTV